MRIIYAVSGEGSGHSSRAKEMARHLIARGHSLHLISYDRGYRTLSKHFLCTEISGLRIVSVDNKVSVVSTLLHNIRGLPALIRSIKTLRCLLDSFQPDCIITDFEPMSAWLASIRKIPLISLDNQHRMRYMHYEAPQPLRRDQWVTEQIIRMMIPQPDAVLATTFFQGAVKNARTFLFPPILRKELGELCPTRGDYHLVYTTSAYDSLLEVLRLFPTQPFIVYGYNRNAIEGNLQFKEFSDQGFLNDLAQCEAVIATAGFTLMSEAMYLQKPYLAFPMRGQFEQQLNGLCLEQLGYGLNAEQADKLTLQNFFERIPEYRAALQHYADGFSNNPAAAQNSAICLKLDELLEQDGALLKSCQRLRQQG